MWSFGCSNKAIIEFTDEEINWLSEHDYITLAVNDSYPPLNYAAHNGELLGLNIDLIRLIELRTGLEIKLVGDTWERSLSMAMKHEVDGIINATPLDERKHKLTFSIPFMDEPQALVSPKNRSNRDENLFRNKKIAAIKTSNQLEVLRALASNIKIIELNTLEEGITMLAMNKIDGVYGSLSPIYHFITSHSLSSFEISYINYDVQASAIGLRNDDLILLNIINKGILSISENEKNMLKERWFHFSSKSDYTLLYITLGVLLLIILLIAIWNITLKNLVKKRTIELNKELEERKATGLKLIGEQQFSNTLLDSFPGLFFMYKFSPEPELIRWNKNFELILNYTSKELKYRHPLSFFDIIEVPKIEQALGQLDLEKETVVETKVLTKNGLKIPYLFIAKKLNLNESNYFFGFGYDMTERVKMAVELEKHRNSLETLVEVKTRELTEANQEISKQKDNYKVNYESVKKLNEIGKEITSSLNLDTALLNVYNKVNELMDADVFGIGIYNKDQQLIEYNLSIERGKKYIPYTRDMKDKNQFPVWCIENKKNVFINDLKNEFKRYIPHYGLMLSSGFLEDGSKPRDPSSIIYVPLTSGGKIIGILTVHSYRKNAYTESNLTVIENLANFISIAIENARSFEQLEKKSIENKILYEISSNLIKPIELDDLLKNTMDAAVKLVPHAQSGAIFLLNSDDTFLEGKVAYAIPNKQIKKVKLKIGEGQAGKAIAEKRSFVENNLHDSPAIARLIMGIYTKPIKSIIVVLLKVNQKIIGTISVDNHDKFNAFTEEDLDILSSMAANASMAIERVRMYELIEEVNADLMMAYSKLKELDDYKDAMTAMIVHDFKNSLNTVISFSEGAPTERRLKSIRQAGQFMLNMVLNILDVQKFETAKIKLALGNYPINKIIDDALEQLNYTMEQKSIKLNYANNSDLYSRVDYELITRVVVNILSNAIKYVTTNGEIDIITEKREENLYVAIIDNGSGIPGDKIGQVFDKFSQLDAKKSGSVRSTGIGLTFCKMVVEAHGGKMGVESTLGEGSNFYFTLPLLIHSNGSKIVIEKSNAKEDNELNLTKKESEFLTPYFIELSNWEVYDYSEVTAIISKMKSKKTKIDLWKKMMMKALQNVNEEEYSQLIKMSTYAEKS